MSELLPRELRDMIYNLLLDTRKRTICLKLPRKQLRHRGMEELTGSVTQYGDKASFCPQFRREYAEIFYSRQSFTVYYVNQLRDLLQTDVFNAGCAPVAFVRRVTWCLIHPRPDLDRLQSTLNMIKDSASMQGFELTLTSSSHWSGTHSRSRMETLERELSETVAELKDHGILVKWDYSQSRRWR
ncbi:hypothetical protein K491DRAFT_315495 [Lophiostoma macrostomum CBS 122681]|uniref:Uncharacterized protein n=1 Tax=Lophiostoma macrostomum CBS 122681 TaxID=1314788 RepID=A0A6A6TCI7_9PLEO|nr:hypothetical protein K491DRAFT_315495 [Lophiostoma macrostomum CBS 122681]